MHTKRILFAAAIVLSAYSPARAAADSYREALKATIAADSANNEMRKASLKVLVARTLAKSRHGVSSDEALRLEESLDRYLATQFVDDIVDQATPCYRENMSEQQLREMAAMLQRPDIRQANNHITSLGKELMGDIAPTMMEAFSALKEGRKPTLPSASACTEEYKSKFETYWASIGVEKVVASTVDKMVGQGINGLDGDKTDGIAATAKAIVNYAVGMTKALMLNRFVGEVPEKELDSMIELMQSDCYRAQLNATMCMASDPMKMLKDTEAAFVEWAKANGETVE